MAVSLTGLSVMIFTFSADVRILGTEHLFKIAFQNLCTFLTFLSSRFGDVALLMVIAWMINLYKPKTYFTYHQKFCVLPAMYFMCYACISEQTAIFSLYSINLSVFITVAECFLRGTNWVFKLDKVSYLKC